jgi:hypothetical protein
MVFDEKPRTRLAIRRAFDSDDGGDRRPSSVSCKRDDTFDDLLRFTPVLHVRFPHLLLPRT